MKCLTQNSRFVKQMNGSHQECPWYMACMWPWFWWPQLAKSWAAEPWGNGHPGVEGGRPRTRKGWRDWVGILNSLVRQLPSIINVYSSEAHSRAPSRPGFHWLQDTFSCKMSSCVRKKTLPVVVVRCHWFKAASWFQICSKVKKQMF